MQLPPNDDNCFDAVREDMMSDVSHDDADRAAFGKRQAEMTARWFENVRRAHGDVDAYIATRHAAYQDRWMEAARFIPNGSSVLDIGGGNHYRSLLEFLKGRTYDYHYLDVDPMCVQGSADQAAAIGMDATRFRQGYNDNLDFSDSTLDAVFSSHCIEHSFDLTKTLSEVNRVLKSGGNFLMAVPFGWEHNPEHPYFFGPTEWLALLRDAGFKIRIAQIGCEYPEHGYDFFVCGQKQGAPAPSRIDPLDYKKTQFTFVPVDHLKPLLQGDFNHLPDRLIGLGSDWRVAFSVPEHATEVLVVMDRHEWSGIVKTSWGSVSVENDLYSWFSYVQPVRVKRQAPPGGLANEVELQVVGQHPASNSSQGVLYGIMFR